MQTTTTKRTIVVNPIIYLAGCTVAMISLVLTYHLWHNWTNDYFGQDRGPDVFDALPIEMAFAIGNLLPIIGLTFVYRLVNPSRTKTVSLRLLEQNAFLLGALILGSAATAMISGVDELPMTPSDVTIMRDMFTLVFIVLFTLVSVQHFNEERQSVTTDT